MKFRMMSIVVALFLSFSAGFGAESSIDGRWTGRYNSGQGGPMDMDYEFKAYGSFLTGTTIGGANGERIPILNGRVNGNKVSFTVVMNRITFVPSQSQVTIQQLKFDYAGDISSKGDKLKLKFILNGDKRNSGSFTVKPKQKNDSLSPIPHDFNYESERQRAFELFKGQNLLGARTILEQLFEVKPDDAEMLEALSFATLATITEEKDPVKQSIIRLQARAMAERAKELGRNSSLLQQFIEQICPDGTYCKANAAKPSPAMEALTEGEIEFNSGRMEQAIAHYERAAQLDPGLYEVPLFTGDAYYALNKKDIAYEYYARAVAINPDRETAYRYWGNVLMSENRLDEAKEKLMESVIREPYSRLPWQFLTNWAARSKIQIGHPRIDIPENAIQKPDDGKFVISVPLNQDSAHKDGSSAWMFYGVSRAAWRMDNNKAFFEAFPNEKEYRHSLPEEYRALSAVVESVRTQLEEGGVRESDLSESIANLLKLHHDGLLEAYIFLAKPDEGIARDYVEYRKNNRDKLRRYLNEYVTAKK